MAFQVRSTGGIETELLHIASHEQGMLIARCLEIKASVSQDFARRIQLMPCGRSSYSYRVHAVRSYTSK